MVMDNDSTNREGMTEAVEGAIEGLETVEPNPDLKVLQDDVSLLRSMVTDFIGDLSNVRTELEALRTLVNTYANDSEAAATKAIELAEVLEESRKLSRMVSTGVFREDDWETRQGTIEVLPVERVDEGDGVRDGR